MTSLFGKDNPMFGKDRRGLNLGMKRSEATKQKMRGEKNHMWKGDDVSYKCLHQWVRRHLPKPELCPTCKSEPPYDAASISGKYLRDLSDWQYLCRRCHQKSDGRMERFIQTGMQNITKYQRRNMHG